VVDVRMRGPARPADRRGIQPQAMAARRDRKDVVKEGEKEIPLKTVTMGRQAGPGEMPGQIWPPVLHLGIGKIGGPRLVEIFRRHRLEAGGIDPREGQGLQKQGKQALKKPPAAAYQGPA